MPRIRPQATPRRRIRTQRYALEQILRSAVFWIDAARSAE